MRFIPENKDLFGGHWATRLAKNTGKSSLPSKSPNKTAFLRKGEGDTKKG